MMSLPKKEIQVSVGDANDVQHEQDDSSEAQVIQTDENVLGLVVFGLDITCNQAHNQRE